MSSTSVNLFYWLVDSAPGWQEALHYFSFVIILHTNFLLYLFLGSFLAKSLIINFLSETTDWPTASGKWQQTVFCITMAWKCKQLDFLVWHVTGYNTTIFLSETQCWSNLSEEQRINTRQEQMQKHIQWNLHIIILKNLYSHDFIDPALNQAYLTVMVQ